MSIQEPMKMTLHLNNRRLWAIIPAAGSGRRFSATELKQYQIIHGLTVLEHSVQRLNELPLAGYVLALSADDHIAKSLSLDARSAAHFCIGGAERVDTVLKALEYLLPIADPQDWVLVHDAARPCVSIESLTALVQTAVQYQCSAILAIPVRDTLKQVVQAPLIAKTVSREQLWQAQTPQISTIATLKKALDQALADAVLVTDEASALEYISAPVQVVQGRSDNIKITYPDDLALARLILESQK